MEHARSLIVITLLQLCRAEISEIIPGIWFSANAINDGYSPKPIMELFSTDTTPGFSPTKPIVVLPHSSRQTEQEPSRYPTTSGNYGLSSTLRPPTSTSRTTYSTYESSTSLPSTIPSSTPSPYPATSSYSPDSTSATTPYPPPENFPIFNFPVSPELLTTLMNQNTDKPFNLPSTQQLTSSLRTTSSGQNTEKPLFLPTSEQLTTSYLTTLSDQNTQRPFTLPGNSQLSSIQSILSSLNTEKAIILPSSPSQLTSSFQTFLSGLNTERPRTTYEVLEPNTITTASPFFSPETQSSPLFFTYQTTPQSVTNPSYTEITSKAPILFPNAVTTSPNDTITPYNTNAYSDGTSRPTVTFRSTPPTISTGSTPKTTKVSNDPTIKVTRPSTPLPPRIIPGPPKGQFSPNLKIRIIAPKGSITNVKINPSTTTKRPPTRKPKVKRIKNTHETCVDHCKGKREPICGVQLGTIIVEPKLLKGFPSICHMACHNSFKKEPYEKIVDGRCGKIRTRIVRIDTGKIHKEELKKAEYSIINSGPQAIVELAGAGLLDDNYRKKH